jgi:PAS domain S-box-containing protein
VTQQRMKWSTVILVVACLPLLFELSFISSLFWLLDRVEQSNLKRSHDLNVAFHASKLLRATIEDGAVYVMAKAGFKKASKRRRSESKEAVRLAMTELQEVLNPEEVEEARYLDRLLQHSHSFNIKVSSLAHEQLSADDSAAATAVGPNALDLVGAMLTESRTQMQKRADRVRAEEANEQRFRFIVQCLVAAGMVLSIALAFLMTLPLSRNLGHKIKHLQENADRLSKQLPIGPPLSGNDEFAQLDMAFRDMARELKESRWREEEVIARAGDLVCALDGQGTFIKANPAAETILGCKGSDLVGRSVMSIAYRGERSKMQATVDGALTDRGNTTFEAQLMKKDGSPVDTSWSISWSATDQAFFCVVHDITARKQAKRARQELIAMISHDLRTPLTGIQLNLDMITTGVYGPLNEADNRALRHARAQAERVVQQVTDLLDIEKLEAGHANLEIVRTPLRTILEDGARNAAALLEQPASRILIEPGDMHVFADKSQIEKVVRNLVILALERIPGDAQLALRAELDEDVARVQVLAPNCAADVEGSLALALCRSIVAAHKGAIGLESLDGNALLWFTLRASTLKR